MSQPWEPEEGEVSSVMTASGPIGPGRPPPFPACPPCAPVPRASSPLPCTGGSQPGVHVCRPPTPTTRPAYGAALSKDGLVHKGTPCQAALLLPTEWVSRGGVEAGRGSGSGRDALGTHTHIHSRNCPTNDHARKGLHISPRVC